MDKLQASADYIQDVTESSNIPESDVWRLKKIRIAILDTGIDIANDTLIKTAIEEGDRIKEYCGFVNGSDSRPDPSDYEDFDGHGTHVTRLILNAAPSAEIFIAKISNDLIIKPQNFHRIARAITWATQKEVDIILMSFGIDALDEAIDKTIETAMENKISIFAAAANIGGNGLRLYPSKRGDGVLAIHASDGLGNDGGISPTPMKNNDNFSTLGIAIPSKWKKQAVSISGTSYATPIAASLAANMLELARCKLDLSEHQQNMLRKYSGVRQILQLMVGRDTQPRGGYDYIVPEINRRLEEKLRLLIIDFLN